MNRFWKIAAINCMLVAIVCAASVSFAEDTLSKTTGLPTDQPYRPVLVNLNNAMGSRPIHGIAAADIVYEMLYWAPGHTRYMAVFGDEYPEEAGFLRGTRVYQVQMQTGWDAPFAYWGGQLEEEGNYQAYIAAQGMPEAFQLDGIYSKMYQSTNVLYQDKDRIPPHNRFVRVRAFVENHWPAAADGSPYEPQAPALVFSQDNPSTGDIAATHVALQYSPKDSDINDAYHPSYVFDEDAHVYIRSYNGELQKDAIDGRQVVAANIIVQYCDVSYYEDIASRPIMDTTGEGEMHAYIGGTRIDGTWKRDADGDPTQYLDNAGNPIALLPGKTFIQMIPLEFAVTQDGDAFSYTWKEGANTSKWNQ